MKQKILQHIEELVAKYNYKELPFKEKVKAHKLYLKNLNGFPSLAGNNIKIKINGKTIATSYSRIVIGDYGAFLEIEENAIKKNKLTIPKRQTWRFDKNFVKQHNLSIKYYHYEFENVMIYHQLNRVTYADYMPGKFYISPLLVDKPNIKDK